MSMRYLAGHERHVYRLPLCSLVVTDCCCSLVAGKCRNPEKRDARSLMASPDVAQADVVLNAVVRRLKQWT